MLTDQDLRNLGARWIDPVSAERALIERVASLIERVASLDGATLIGRNGSGDYSGLAIPNVWPGESRPREFRLRRDNPEIVNGKPERRYLSPHGRGNLLYFAPGTDVALLEDPSTPLILTEGEFKCIALSRLACHESERPRWLVAAIPGVWSWRGVIGKTTDADGNRVDVKGPISDLNRIIFDSRWVLIAFDADLESNDSVEAARRMLTRELRQRGAVVCHFRWPDDRPPDAKGVDDLLAAWGPNRVLPLITDALQREVGQPDLLTFSMTDTGNAERLVAMSGSDLRYCYAFKKWLLWTGTHWSIDDSGGALKIAKQAMKTFLHQAIERNDAAIKFATSSLDARRLEAMLKLAASELPIHPSELDTSPDLLNFENGTVDLRDGRLRPNSRRDYITKLIRFDYRQNARCPRWLKFLDEIAGASPDASEEELACAAELTDFLQLSLGYSVTGCVRERVVCVCYGPGANGKTVLLSVVRDLIADYATVVGLDLLVAKDESNNVAASRASLLGARFCMSSETEEGQRLSAARLKRICQGDGGNIEAARKYENPISFPETHKLWIDANHKPDLPASDAAVWQRLRLIPFLVVFPLERQDRNLRNRLLAEAEGILSWLVHGAVRWHAEGLPASPIVDAATTAWRAETNRLGAFIEDRLETAPDGWIGARELYNSYVNWCEAEHEGHPLSSRKFAAQFAAMGYAKIHKESGNVWTGLRFRSCG